MDTRQMPIWVYCLFLAACGSAAEKGGDDVVVIDGEHAANDGTSAADDDDDDSPQTRVEPTDETTPPVRAPMCGDSNLDPDEACDDGNIADRDGCSEVCEIETVVLRNLEAILAEGDDLSRCGDGSNFACDASYGISLTIANFTDFGVARVSHIRVTFDGVELSSGGQACDAELWQVRADSTSNIIDLGLGFHSNRYSLYWPCTDETNRTADTYVDQRSYAESGELKFEISGLLDDGSVWQTTATTTLKDLR